MTKIIELAHALGEEIAISDEIKALEIAKEKYEKDADLQSKLGEYEAERKLLAEEFAKAEGDTNAEAITKLKARLDELARVITVNQNYVDFANAQKAMNDLMNEVNAEIKFCITGERPASCTHDCSTCSGCAH
jgi:cell fate (sporulation/competence/biofilm development) regulator YlbF (YheA/YmcA/DUF963 family)